MPKTALEQWDETAANNTDVGGVDIDEGCAPSGMNNAHREEMAQFAKWLGDDTLASASTTDLGSVPGRYVNITGTTTITVLGTIKAGTIKYLKFAGALTLTHNATTLILPGATNITTAAGDTAVFVSEGSGNWRCLAYQLAAQAPISYATGTFSPTIDGTSTAGAGTYTRQFGRYTKIGRQVFIEVDLVWTAHTGTGNIILSGLPFTSSGAGSNNTPVSIAASALTFTGQLVAYVPSNSSQIQIRTISSGAGVGDVAMDTNASIFLAGSYVV